MSLQPKKIRWGVLGYARIARESLIPAILRSSNSTLQAVASRDGGKLAECHARYAVPHLHGNYQELLADPDVDAVYLPLPNSLHCEWTVRAAEHGKHILCEKPLALTAHEGRRMAEACAQHGVTLMEAFMYRYTDRTRQVLEVVRSGALGEIKFVSASFRFLLTRPDSIKLKPGLGGGSLYDVGCYPVNFVGMIADAVRRAAGETTRAVPDAVVGVAQGAGGIDQIFSGLLTYPGGLVAAVHSGFNAHKRVVAEIVGTAGVLEIPETFFDPAGVLTLTCGEERREYPVAASDRYRAEIEDFAAALIEGRPPLCPVDESLRNLDVLDRLLACR